MRWLTYRIFRLLGWTIEGDLPDVPKMVIIGAPHTSNWDFFLFLAVIYHFHVRAWFLLKSSMFRWPLGGMFRKAGGIAVDRTRPGGLVQQVKDAFDARDELILVIAPEGTRKATGTWKSGFVKIAEVAEVPVVFAGVDGPKKTIYMSGAEEVGTDRFEFMDRVRSFYDDMPGLRPEGKGPIRLGGEAVSS